MEDVYSCKQGFVRNPRTDRCVRADLPLGAAIDAAAKAARSGLRAPPCPSARHAYNFATKTCVADGRAGAIRAVQKAMRASNANSALAAKNVTSKIFDSVKTKNFQTALEAKNYDIFETRAEAGAIIAYLRDALEKCKQRELQLSNAILK